MIAFALMLLVAGANEVEVLRDAGLPANRLDLVILGDGYRAQDQAKLTSDGNLLVTRLFNVTPWKEYAGIINVSLVHVVSNEAGADNGSAGAQRDTALGAYFGCFGVDRTICVNDSAVLAIAAQVTPEYDQLVVLVNDSKYGGAGGHIATVSTNAQAPEILIHELGHSVAALADEYDTAYPAYPACGAQCPEVNVSTSASPKWSAWLESSTPVPTPEMQPQYAEVIGAFEGARYKVTGLYRPKDNCLMKVLGKPNCSVCAEGVILKLFNRVDPIDSFQPTQAMSACGQVTFEVTPVPVAPITYTWRVNGAERLSGPSLSLAVGSGLTVSVTATHTTPLVRRDPLDLLKQTITFPSVSPGLGCADAGLPEPVDAGTPEDAGQEPEPSQPDAGMAAFDGGSVEAPEADAGASSPLLSLRVQASSEGCGCEAAPSSLLLLGLLALRSGTLRRRE